MNAQTSPSEVELAPLTKWKNPPTIRELKQDLLEARSSHSAQETKINEWLDNLNISGKAKVNTGAGNSKIVPKLIRKQAEWRYASLSEPFLSTDDIFNVRPVTWEDKAAAEQNQLLLAHQFNTQLDKTTTIDEYVRTAVDEGTVIVRVGWETEEEQRPEQVPLLEFRVNPEMAPVHEELAQLKAQSPSQYATDIPDHLKQAHDLTIERGIPIEAVILAYEEKMVTRVTKNQPTVDICDFRNILIDPTCMGKIDKAAFVIYSFESSLSQLEKDGKYKNLKKIVPSDSSVLVTPDHHVNGDTQSFNFSDEPRKKLVVHEYWGFWDIDGSGIVKPIVAAWVGNTLIRLEENPYPDKKVPFVTVQYLPVRKSIYGEPDGALLEDNQRVIGAVTRGMIDIMGKSANGQLGVRKDFLDTTNQRKFDQGKDYQFNPNVDPRTGVYMHTFPEIPQSAHQMVQLQSMEAESLTGVKSFSQGISGASLGNVASLGRGALDAASKRELGILRRLSDGIVKIGRKIISMNAEFLSEEEVVRVTNDEFVRVRRDDLPGNFDLVLTISTAEEDNAKAQELAFMLQTTGNGMDPGLSKIILSDIAKLRKMPDLAKRILTFEPEPDPIAEQKAMLELQLLQSQIQETLAKAASYGASAQLNTAKSGTETVKQGNLQSDTDQKNLDFVEQESGVKQARDLQKQGEQARSQLNTKIVDHQLNEKSAIRDYLLNKKD